jgi:hypothetical protein
MTAHLGAAELNRLRRQGVVALGVDEGLALLDTALVYDAPTVVPVRLDLGRMQRDVALATEVPALLRARCGCGCGAWERRRLTLRRFGNG